MKVIMMIHDVDSDTSTSLPIKPIIGCLLSKCTYPAICFMLQFTNLSIWIILECSNLYICIMYTHFRLEYLYLTSCTISVKSHKAHEILSSVSFTYLYVHGGSLCWNVIMIVLYALVATSMINTIVCGYSYLIRQQQYIAYYRIVCINFNILGFNPYASPLCKRSVMLDVASFGLWVINRLIRRA